MCAPVLDVESALHRPETKLFGEWRGRRLQRPVGRNVPLVQKRHLVHVLAVDKYVPHV